MLVHAHSAGPARVTVRVSGRPARRPCALYSVTGSNAQARNKLHGLVWLRSDFTVLVRLKHTSVRRRRRRHGAVIEGEQLALPRGPEEVWAIDFVMDALLSGGV